jgi:hypothetical protein
MHTTPWFNALKSDPEHDGSYETFARSEDAVTLRRWTEHGWDPAFRQSDDAPHWRGVLSPEPVVEHKIRESTLFATSPVVSDAPAESVAPDPTPRNSESHS